MHVSSDGDTLSQTDGFWWPRSVSVDPADGTCWVADSGLQGPLPYGTVTHLGPDGSRLAVLTDFLFPSALAVDPGDGSCWVADTGNMRLVHLSAAGDVLWQSGDLAYVYSVAVNPADGSCWAGASGEVLHLDVGGAVLSRTPVVEYAPSISADPRDGSCWVAEVDLSFHFDYVLHLSSAGAVLWRSDGLRFFGPESVWASLVEGSCLVADTQHDQIVLLAPDGTELWRLGGFSLPMALSGDPVGGAIYVGDGGMHNQIAKLMPTAASSGGVVA
jgi:DNA-binding beta-propeller fold protein YncE